MPEKAQLVEAAEGHPVPVHAYAASGEQAPRIIRRQDGTPAIECPRCNAYNSIDADTCGACGTPFTIDAAPTVGRMRRDSRAVRSIVLGVLGMLLFPLAVPSLLAMWWGVQSAMFVGAARRSNLGLVGAGLGLLSLIGGGVFWYFRLK
jgi:hypothetical protein